MKRILLSAGMAIFMGAVIAGGTGAFFSDEETSTGNTFTAGALDLKVDSVAHYNGLICFEADQEDGTVWIPVDQVEWVPGVGDEDGAYELVGDADVAAAILAYNTENPAANPGAGEDCGGTWELTDLGLSNVFFEFEDLKPGDTGENTVSIHVENNDAFMCAAIHDVENNDNGLTEPEGEDGDVTAGPLGGGELGDALFFRIWEDGGDNILQEDELPVLTQGPASDIEDGVVYTLYDNESGPFTGGETGYLGVQWCYGEFDVVTGECDGSGVNNITQTDSFLGDITFYVEQARNNTDFECPGIEEFELPSEEV